MMARYSKLVLLAAAVAALLISNFVSFDSYFLIVIITIGINIILATSLNLINGHTGQFSLGHAGFMAVGSYTAAKFSLLLQPLVPPWAQPFVFLTGLLLGGVAASLVGFGVGVPTLQLRGD